MKMKSKRRPCREKRVGTASLEVVLITGIMFPALVLAAFLGIRACRVIFTLIGTMVGSPIL